MPFQKNLITRIDPKVYRPVGLMPVVKQYEIKTVPQVSRDIAKPLAKSRTALGKGLRKNLNAKALGERNKQRAAQARMEKQAGLFDAAVKLRAYSAAFPFVGEAVRWVGGRALSAVGHGIASGAKATARGAANAVKYTVKNPGQALKRTGKAVGYTAAGLGGLAGAGALYAGYKGVKHIVAPTLRMGFKGVKGAAGLVTGTVGTAVDLGKAAVKAPFSLLSGANSMRKGINSLSTMSQPAKAALGLGTAATAYAANEYATKYKEQKAEEQAMGGMYDGIPTEDQYVGKMASYRIEATKDKANVVNDKPNIPADTSTPNSNNPEDYGDMYDYQEFVNTEGHPDRENLPNHIEQEPRKVAHIIGADIAVISEINEYTGHPRYKTASMTYRQKLAASNGSKLLGASLVLGGTGIAVGQLNKKDGEFKTWKPNYYVQ